MDPLTWKEHLWHLLKYFGASIDFSWSDRTMTLTEITIRFRGKEFHSGDEIKEHSYFCPSPIRVFGYFMLTPQFSDLMDELKNLLTDHDSLKRTIAAIQAQDEK